MAINSIRRRLEKKLGRRKPGPKVKSIAKRVTPRAGDMRKSIDGPSHHARIEEFRDALHNAIVKVRTDSLDVLRETLDESLVLPLREVVSRFILMQLGGWKAEGDKLIHEGGVVINKGKLEAKDGKLVTPSGQPFKFCESDKLHAVREDLDKTIRLLDLERKFDLFTGLQEMVDGR